MDWIILASLTALSAFTGYRKGALMMAWRLIAFIAAYVVAWKLTPSLAQWLLDNHKIQGVIVYPAAGVILFLGTGIALSIISALLFLLVPSHIKSGGKLVGALLGGSLGLVFALLCVWAIGIVRHTISQHQQTITPTNAVSITSPPSAVRQFAGKIMSDAAQTVMDDRNSAASATAQLLADPVSTSKDINYLARQPDVRELFQNRDNYHTMVNGTADDIMEMPAFQQLMNDKKTIDFLSKAGLADNTTPDKQKMLANHLSTYAKNIDKIKNTREYNDVMADPEIKAAMQAGQYSKLLTNEKVRLLTEMITHGSSNPHANTSSETINNTPHERAKNSVSNDDLSQTVYRWTDKEGKTHYSDNPPQPSDVSGDVTQVTR